MSGVRRALSHPIPQVGKTNQVVIEEFFGELDDDFVLILEVALATNWTQEIFNANELEEGAHASVNNDASIRAYFISM